MCWEWEASTQKPSETQEPISDWKEEFQQDSEAKIQEVAKQANRVSQSSELTF